MRQPLERQALLEKVFTTAQRTSKALAPELPTLALRKDPQSTPDRLARRLQEYDPVLATSFEDSRC